MPKFIFTHSFHDRTIKNKTLLSLNCHFIIPLFSHFRYALNIKRKSEVQLEYQVLCGLPRSKNQYLNTQIKFQCSWISWIIISNLIDISLKLILNWKNAFKALNIFER